MAINTQNVSGTTPATATTTYLSVGALGDTNAVTFMSVCNHHATDPVLVDIYIVPDGIVTPGTAQLLVSQLEIVAGDTYIVYQGNEKIFLDPDDRIDVVADVAGQATVITSFMKV